MAFSGLGVIQGKLGVVGGGSKLPRIAFSGLSQAEGTATGTVIGTLSVKHGSGVYTFAKTVDADAAFTLTVATIKNAIIFNYATKTSHTFTVTADNGVDPVLTATFTVQVISVSVPAAGKFYQLLFAA